MKDLNFCHLSSEVASEANFSRTQANASTVISTCVRDMVDRSLRFEASYIWPLKVLSLMPV